MSRLLDQIALDKKAFFDTGSGFAVVGQIDGVDVDMIFDSEYVDVPAGGPFIESASPAVLVWQDDAPETTDHGSEVIVNDRSYRVKNKRADGTGELVLMLEGPL